MDSQTEAQKVAEEYSSSLSELDFSKISINALTMLAEDSKDYAAEIATCIENHLRNVPSKKKLPVLYLIDSICKNFRQSIYVQLFTQNIVSNFCSVFEVSPEKTRKCLHKLRTTWETAKTFPQNKLHAIDERVHKMDPNWPITHKKPSQKQTSSQKQAPPQKGASQAHQQSVQQPQPPPVLQPPPQPIQHQTLQPVQQLLQPPPLQPIQQLLQQPLQQPLQQLLPQPVQQPIQQPIQQPLQQQLEYKPHSLPDGLDLTLDSLYGGKQCSNCSLRFDDSNKYSIHLDWHFRQNLKSDNMFARRKWYYPLNLWVQFREINDDDIQETSISDSINVNELLISHNDHEVPYAPASIEDAKNICPVCHETFEKFWDEDEEEWRLRNARLHDDERVYHPLCLMDMLQASVAK